VNRASSQALPVAFAQLFREHAPFVWRVLRRHGVPERDLDDGCQAVFLVVHRRLPEFEGRANVRTWIYEIARRVALSEQRRAHVRREIPGESLAQEPSTAPGPDRQLERKRAIVWLEQALSALHPDKREAFVLYELEQMTLAEVAQTLGCPLQTVHYRVKTAREEIRAYEASGLNPERIASPKAHVAARPRARERSEEGP
jgi:RNA polymerase sigma-70 factor, ECF subfamily